MHRSYLRLAFVICVFCLISCSNEEEIAPLALDPLPEGSVAFLRIDIDDQEFNLINGEGNSVFSSSLNAPAEPDAQFSKEFGSSVTSDTSTLSFRVAYSRQANTRLEMLHEITQREGRIAFGEYIDQELIERRTGFNVEIAEYDYPGGPGVGYSSWRTEQPESSFFTIHEYYAGDTQYTIWLKGEFDLSVDRQIETLSVKGEFLMEFPVCCFE